MSKKIKGGSWGGNAYGLQSTVRDWAKPSFRYRIVGFRLVRTKNIQMSTNPNDPNNLPQGLSHTWGQSWYDQTPTPYVPSTESTTKEHCYHDWVEYRGFVEDYRFCTKCGEKKDHGLK